MSNKKLHPSFGKKHVLQLDCVLCGNCVCERGMKAILLADTTVELYSTDIPPYQSVDLVNDPYCTEKCKCKIKDFACLQCGNVIGYMVVHPCRICLESCNNGHLWMFYSSAIESSQRLFECDTGCDILRWGHLVDEDNNAYTEIPVLQHKTLECGR